MQRLLKLQEEVVVRRMFLEILLGFIGISAGLFCATGFFALITMLGLINRFAQKTRTAMDIVWYEECVIFGVTIGTVWMLFQIILPFGNMGVAVIGLFGGIYAGCLSVALAETIKTIPILIRRVKIEKGIGTGILLFAIGKSIGSLIYFFWLNYIGKG